MSYSVSLSENGKFIACKVSGPITLDVAQEFTMELYYLSRTTGVKRFLVDIRDAPNAMSVSQTYNFAYKAMENLNFQRDIRGATLISLTDKTHYFSETVVQNAGYNMRLFHDEEATFAWLFKEKPSK